MHIDRRVSNGLCTVDEHRDVVPVGDVDDTLHVVDGTERVVHMSHADEARARRNESLELAQDEVAVLVRGDCLQRGTFFASHLLPGHDVGVVVELADDDLVARRQELPSIGLRHEVDTLGGAAYEDDLLAGSGIDEALHLLAGLLVGISSTSGQRVGTAMDVAIIVLIIVADLVDDLNRLLRGGAVVEPYEVVAVHLLMEHGEVLLDLLRIQRVHFLIVQVAQLLRLRNADAEAVVLRHSLHRTARIVRIAEVRQVGIAASATQQLLEARLQLREVQGLVRQHTQTSLPDLLGAISLGDLSKQRKAWVFDAVAVNILDINHYFSTLFRC